MKDKMDRAAEWCANAPPVDDLFQVLTLAALSTAPQGEHSKDELESLYREVAAVMTRVATLNLVLRQCLSIGITDGELGYALTERGREDARAL